MKSVLGGVLGAILLASQILAVPQAYTYVAPCGGPPFNVRVIVQLSAVPATTCAMGGFSSVAFLVAWDDPDPSTPGTYIVNGCCGAFGLGWGVTSVGTVAGYGSITPLCAPIEGTINGFMQGNFQDLRVTKIGYGQSTPCTPGPLHIDCPVGFEVVWDQDCQDGGEGFIPITLVSPCLGAYPPTDELGQELSLLCTENASNIETYYGLGGLAEPLGACRWTLGANFWFVEGEDADRDGVVDYFRRSHWESLQGMLDGGSVAPVPGGPRVIFDGDFVTGKVVAYEVPGTAPRVGSGAGALRISDAVLVPVGSDLDAIVLNGQSSPKLDPVASRQVAWSAHPSCEPRFVPPPAVVAGAMIPLRVRLRNTTTGVLPATATFHGVNATVPAAEYPVLLGPEETVELEIGVAVLAEEPAAVIAVLTPGSGEPGFASVVLTPGPHKLRGARTIRSVSLPVDSMDSSCHPRDDDRWSMETPPYPFDLTLGIGNLVRPSWVTGSADFSLHDHGYIGPNVPDPAEARITYTFDGPVRVEQLEVIQHANGITRVEGFVGDSLDTLTSVGSVFGTLGDATGPAVFPEGLDDLFVFPEPRFGRIFQVVVRKTSLTNGWAGYRMFPRDERGRRFPVARTP